MNKKVNVSVSIPEPKLNAATVSFSFAHLNDVSYTKAKRDGGYFIGLLERLKKYSQLNWQTLYATHKHGFGTETIETRFLSAKAKGCLTDDVNKVIVLRSSGDNRALVGYREGNVFNVLFIEYEFGDVYSHG